MTTPKPENLKIADYLKERLGHLRTCDAEIESHLLKDVDESINTFHDEDMCEQYLVRIDLVVRNTFRYCMLIAICTFLEESFKLLCDHAISDYETKLTRKGSWLLRHRKLLAKHSTADLSSVKEQLDIMENFVTVRNCLTHQWGKVHDCRKKKQVEKIVKEASYFTLLPDGYIVVGNDAVPTTILSSGEIIDKLLADLLNLQGYNII